MSTIAAFMDALPAAIGMIAATAPMVTVPLILVSRPDPVPHHAFILGWMAGLAAVGTAAIALSDLSTAGPAPPAVWVVWLRLILGSVLILLAAKKWRGRQAADKTPAWMTSLDSMRTGTAFGLGATLAAINPKNAVIAATGALTVAAATPTVSAQAAAYAAFIVVASLGLLAPLLLTLTLGERATRPLATLRDWMGRHSNAILGAVLLILGVITVWKAVGYL